MEGTEFTCELIRIRLAEYKGMAERSKLELQEAERTVATLQKGVTEYDNAIVDLGRSLAILEGRKLPEPRTEIPGQISLVEG